MLQNKQTIKMQNMYRKQIRVMWRGLWAHAIPISTLFALHLPPSHQPGHNILINNDAVAIHFRFLQKAAAMKTSFTKRLLPRSMGTWSVGQLHWLIWFIFLLQFLYFYIFLALWWQSGQRANKVGSSYMAPPFFFFTRPSYDPSSPVYDMAHQTCQGWSKNWPKAQ